MVKAIFLHKHIRVLALRCGHCHHEYSFNKGYSQAGGSILLLILVSVNEIIPGYIYMGHGAQCIYGSYIW